MTLPRQHYLETERLLKKISKGKIAAWLLEEGYFPEQYILPPAFKIKSFPLNATPNYLVSTFATSKKFEPKIEQLVSISFPKTDLTDRTYSMIHPSIYHDIVWYLLDDWEIIMKHLFNKNQRIYSYSLPIPVTNKSEGNLGKLRAGRMIYEFLEMAESDLVAEGHNYKYLLVTDVSNCYNSIYTHSIAWALHSKAMVRRPGNRSSFDKFLGLKLDKLFQSSNDGCTNGISVGSAVSDLVAEIVLTAIDLECSEELVGVDFLGVRFKDDYRILCNSKSDAETIIKTLQSKMRTYQLSINENKTNIKGLPEGLFRLWPIEYQKYSLKYVREIKYKRFETSLLATLEIDKSYSNANVIDKFLSELTTKKMEIKLKLSEKEILKVFSLLMMLKERRSKSFPQILAIVEKLLEMAKSNPDLSKKLIDSIKRMLEEKFRKEEDNQYDLIWLIYFVKSQELFSIVYPTKIKSALIKSLKNNRAEFFKPHLSTVKLYEPIKKAGSNKILLEHLSIFNK